MTIFNGPYIAPFRPLSNITPFTYRDGLTYLEVLEEIRSYVNDDLVAFINNNFNQLGTDFEEEVTRLITEINTAIDEQQSNVDAELAAHTTFVNSSIATLTTNVNNAVTSVNTAVTNVNNALAAQTAANNAALAAQTAANTAAINAAVTTITESTIDASEPVFVGLIEDLDSEVRILLDSIYAIAVDDSTIAGLVNNNASATRVSLNTHFANKATETTINSGRLSSANVDSNIETVVDDDYITTFIANGASDVRAELNTHYLKVGDINPGMAFRKLANQAALIALSGVTADEIAMVDNIDGAYFKHNGTAWVMYGVPIFTNAAAITSAITTPAAGMYAKSNSSGVTYRHNGTKWLPFSSDWISYIPRVFGPTLGNGIILGKFKFEYGDIHLRGFFKFGSTSAMSTNPRWGVPDGIFTETDFSDTDTGSELFMIGQAGIQVGGTWYPGTVRTKDGPSESGTYSAIDIYVFPTVGATFTNHQIKAANPATWATGSILFWDVVARVLNTSTYYV